MSNDQEVVRDLLAILAEGTERCRQRMDAQEISNAIYGLQNMQMNNNDIQLRKVIKALAKKCRLMQGSFSSQSIGMILCGVRGSGIEPSHDALEMESLIQEIAIKMREVSNTVQLSSQSCALAVGSLRSLSSSNAATRLLLSSLTPLIISSKELLSKDQVCHCIAGVRRMHSEQAEVMDLISAILSRASRNGEYPSGKNLCHAVYSLQRMSDSNPVVQKLLRLLGDYIPDVRMSSTGTRLGDVHLCRGRDISMALYGLQGCAGSAAVLHLLHRLQPLFCQAVTDNDIDMKSIAMAMLGLRRLSSNSEEVRTILRDIATAIRILSAKGIVFSGHALGMCMIGMQSMDGSCSEVRDILRLLLSVMPAPAAEEEVYDNIITPEIMSKISENTDSVEYINPTMDAQGFAMALYGLRNLSASTSSREVHAFLGKLAPMLIPLAAKLTRRDASMALQGLRQLNENGVPSAQRLSQILIRRLEEVGQKDVRLYLNAVVAQTWMPLMLGFFLLQEQINHSLFVVEKLL